MTLPTTGVQWAADYHTDQPSLLDFGWLPNEQQQWEFVAGIPAGTAGLPGGEGDEFVLHGGRPACCWRCRCGRQQPSEGSGSCGEGVCQVRRGCHPVLWHGRPKFRAKFRVKFRVKICGGTLSSQGSLDGVVSGHRRSV